MKYISKKADTIEWILFVVLSAQVILICYINLVNLPYLLDQDSAPIISHAMEIIKQKNFLLTDFIYSTTLELDSPLLMAVCIYPITKNMMLSFGLASLICTALFCLLLFSILTQLNIRRKVVLITFIILFIPFGTGSLEYFNMMFLGAAQYITKITMGICAVDIVLKLESNLKTGKKLLIAEIVFLFCGLLVTSLSSGVFVLVNTILPIIFCYVLFSAVFIVK